MVGTLIDHAIVSHTRCVELFNILLANGLCVQSSKALEEGNPRACELGRWLQTEESWRMLGPLHNEVEQRHNEFHHAANFLAAKFCNSHKLHASDRLAEYLRSFEKLAGALNEALGATRVVA